MVVSATRDSRPLLSNASQRVSFVILIARLEQLDRESLVISGQRFGRIRLLCPLSGVKRTCVGRREMSAFEGYRTLGNCDHANYLTGPSDRNTLCDRIAIVECSVMRTQTPEPAKRQRRAAALKIKKIIRRCKADTKTIMRLDDEQKELLERMRKHL